MRLGFEGSGTLTSGLVAVLALAACDAGDREAAEPQPTHEVPMPESEPSGAEDTSGAAPAPLEVEQLEVTEPLVARLRAELTNAAQIETVIRASAGIHEPDGGDTIFVLYDVDGLEHCAHLEMEREGTTLREATRHCREQLSPPSEDGTRRFSPCTYSRLVRFEVEPRAPGTAEEDRSFARQAGTDIVGICIIATIRSFRLADVDHDGRVEVEIDYAHAIRVGGTLEIGAQTREFYDGVSLRRQLDCNNALPEASGSSSAQRVSFSDENGDGHPDAVVRRVDYDVASNLDDCDVDPDTTWPRGAARPSEEEGAPGCAITRDRTTVRFYVPGSDEYRAEP